MAAPGPANPLRREVAGNVWLGRADANPESELARLTVQELRPDVIQTEELVGRAMLAELEAAAQAKEGPIVFAILGGRGGQALHKLLGERARAGDPGGLIPRLHIFTQDALAPMRVENGLSFVRDFRRLLGDEFFRRVGSFNTMRTDAPDLEVESARHVQKLEAMGGLDIFFLGLGPESGGSSHLAYIKPNSGASVIDMAGVIPISASILQHHIAKFKVGGSTINAEDEAECRRATHILTLGPAAILGARRIVQSVVDADTAPAKRESYRKLMETHVADDVATRARQLDANPGLWIRFHPNVRSLILPNVLTT
jgi:6-phosphogluconolactonase/glucosamine-6-phosphate isomerase/deaminase